MIPAEQALIRPGDLARELGVSPVTISRWAKRLEGARWSRHSFLVSRLRAMGVLPPAQSQPVPSETP